MHPVEERSRRHLVGRRRADQADERRIAVDHPCAVLHHHRRRQHVHQPAIALLARLQRRFRVFAVGDVLVGAIHDTEGAVGVAGGAGATVEPRQRAVVPHDAQVIGELVRAGAHRLDPGDRPGAIVWMQKGDEPFQARRDGGRHAEQLEECVGPPDPIGRRLPAPTAQAGGPLGLAEAGIGVAQGVLGLLQVLDVGAGTEPRDDRPVVRQLRHLPAHVPAVGAVGAP